MLNKAAGLAFDKLWVQMMIQHHTGAIAMAKTELAQGHSAQTKSLTHSTSPVKAARSPSSARCCPSSVPRPHVCRAGVSGHPAAAPNCADVTRFESEPTCASPLRTGPPTRLTFLREVHPTYELA